MTDLDEIRELILDQYEVNKQMHLNTQEALKAIMQFLEKFRGDTLPMVEMKIATKDIFPNKQTRGEKESVGTAEISAKGSSIEKAIDDSKPVVQQEVVERINLDKSTLSSIVTADYVDQGKSYMIYNENGKVAFIGKSLIESITEFEGEFKLNLTKKAQKWFTADKINWQEDKYK